MAYQVDKLVKIGKEGFALLDEMCDRKKKHQHRYVYPGPKVITVWEPVIDNNQAAHFFGGKSVVDHRIAKPIPGAYY